MYQMGSPSRWQRMQTSPESALTEKKYLIGRVARSTQRALGVAHEDVRQFLVNLGLTHVPVAMASSP